MLKNYDSTNYQQEWDEIIKHLLICFSRLSQMRAALQLKSQVTAKISVPPKMYRRLATELRKHNPSLHEKDGVITLQAQLGDVFYIYNSDAALNDVEVHIL